MANVLDTNFTHSVWYKGLALTKRQALEGMASSDSFSIRRMPRRNVGNALGVPPEYCNCIVSEEGERYAVSAEELEYFIDRRKFWNSWKEIFRADYLAKKGEFYSDYFELMSTAMFTVPLYKDFAAAAGFRTPD